MGALNFRNFRLRSRYAAPIISVVVAFGGIVFFNGLPDAHAHAPAGEAFEHVGLNIADGRIDSVVDQFCPQRVDEGIPLDPPVSIEVDPNANKKTKTSGEYGDDELRKTHGLVPQWWQTLALALAGFSFGLIVACIRL